jgi:hypothetical protein
MLPTPQEAQWGPTLGMGDKVDRKAATNKPLPVKFKYVNPAEDPRKTEKSSVAHDQFCNFRAHFE